MSNKDYVKMIREKYKKGTRIRLIYMIDPFGLPAGSLGTVRMVDDMGQIHMIWDSGRTLALIPEVDSFEIVK